MELGRDYEMTNRSRFVAASVGAPILAMAELALLGWIVDLGLLGGLALGLALAMGQAAWLAAPQLSPVKTWSAVAAAGIVYVTVLGVVLLAVVSALDSMQ